MTTYVNFTKDKFERFKRAYAECDGDVFTFEKKPFLKDYAKHLIEYLTPKFPDPKPDPVVVVEKTGPKPEPQAEGPAAEDSSSDPEPA